MARKNQQREILVKEQKRKQRRTLLIALGAVLALVLIFLLVQRLNAFTPRSEFVQGKANAPVDVLGFSDYRCSHCADFAINQEPDFLSQYVETGKVRYTFINFPFMAADSMDAAVAATCAAEQDKFWQYQKELFSRYNQANAFLPANLESYAQSLGLDLDKFRTCLASEATLSYINKGMLYAGRLGVSGTPSFVVNGKLVYSNALVQTVEDALAGK